MDPVVKSGSTYAVVGASNSKEKYGNKVFLDLMEAGHVVIPINPREETIEGVRAYPSLKDYAGRIDIVVTVVPPKITEAIVEECRQLGIRTIWMQPGSESQEAVRRCEEHGIRAIHNACIMIERKRSNLSRR